MFNVTAYVGIGGASLKKDIFRFCKKNHLTIKGYGNDIMYEISGNFLRMWKLHRYVKKLQKSLFTI